jgi:hypothetical protein
VARFSTIFMETLVTPISDAAAALAYEMAVISLYFSLPHMPLNVSRSDRLRVRRWWQDGITVELIEAALLLGSLRRLSRPPQAPPLAPVRSLAYFQPVIEELLEMPPPPRYTEYLRLKLQPWLAASR